MATSTSYIPNHKSMPATSPANPQQQMQKPVNEMLEHSNGSVGASQPMTAAPTPSPPQPSVQTFPSVHINPTTFPVYIGNLGSDITESHLVPFVHSSGVSLSSARVCRSSDTRKSLNYAFLNFHSKVIRILFNKVISPKYLAEITTIALKTHTKYPENTY